MHSRSISAARAAALLALAALLSWNPALRAGEPAREGDKPTVQLDGSVPSFEIYDAAGAPVSTDGLLKGKVTVLFFWYHENKDSLDELKALKKMLSEEKFKGVQLITATKALDAEDRAAVVATLKKEGIDIKPYFDDKKLTFANAFSVTRLPSFYIVDKEGVLRTLGVNSATKPVRGDIGFRSYLTDVVKDGVVPTIDFQRLEADHKFWSLVGKKAPAFELDDLSGRKHSPEKYEGRKNLLIVFWMVTCPHCQKELPKLQEFYLKYKDALDVEILGVTIPAEGEGSASRKSIEDFLNKSLITFPVLMGKKETFDAFSVNSWPAMFAVDKKGVVVEPIAGELRFTEKMLYSIFAKPEKLKNAD